MSETQTAVQTAQPQPPAKKPMTIKNLFERDDIKSKFQEMLGKKSQGFITSVLQIVTSSDKLKNADPLSVYHSAAVAATLDLPLNNNLGFAYIVPYKTRQSDGTFKTLAQFQMGYKGFKQLAQRSGQFAKLNSTDVREGEIILHDRLTGDIKFEWIQDQKLRLATPVTGYVAYFRLLNGFEKTLLMYVDEIKQHGQKYSKTYSQEYGLWNTDFNNMAHKTVTKLLLSKDAPLSIDMQTAIKVDQAVINDADANDVTYVDVEHEEVNKESERMTLMIQDATNLEELEDVYNQIGDDFNEAQMEVYLTKKEALTPKPETTTSTKKK